jgi:hypothetical protein
MSGTLFFVRLGNKLGFLNTRCDGVAFDFCWRRLLLDHLPMRLAAMAFLAHVGATFEFSDHIASGDNELISWKLTFSRRVPRLTSPRSELGAIIPVSRRATGRSP